MITGEASPARAGVVRNNGNPDAIDPAASVAAPVRRRKLRRLTRSSDRVKDWFDIRAFHRNGFATLLKRENQVSDRQISSSGSRINDGGSLAFEQ
jgi:hypothetical protein